MKDLFKKDNINGIWISIVAGILLSQIFDPMIQIGKNLGKGTINALIDYFFYSCSRADNVGFANYILYFAFILMILPPIKDAVSLVWSFRKREDTSKNTKEETIERKPKDLLDDILEIRINEKKLENKRKKDMIFLKIISVICTAFLILIFCNIVIYRYMPTVFKESFDRRIIQITPYVEREKIDLLKSNWVSMETKDDYMIIAEEIHSILLENGLK